MHGTATDGWNSPGKAAKDCSFYLQFAYQTQNQHELLQIKTVIIAS
jgi:hypothetical protein